MLSDLAAEAAGRFGDQPAFVAEEGWSLSWRELDRVSDEVAVGLARRGVGEGDVVAVVLPTIPEYVVAYVAAAKLGAVTAGVNARLSPAERSAVLGVASPKVVLALGELAPDAGEVEEVTPATTSVDEMLRPLRVAGEAPPSLTPDDDRAVAIVFTSGTTGVPRGATFGFRQLEAVAMADTGGQWGIAGRTLAGTSLTHSGTMTKISGTLRGGGTTFMVKRWRADDAVRRIEAHQLTTTGGIPTQLALMLRVPDFERYDTSSLRVIAIGGGPAAPALIRDARVRFGLPVVVLYSCTESAIGTATAPDAPDEDAEVSVGRARGGVEILILDDNDRPVPRGEVGAVCLRSPAVMSGYWHDVSATAAAFTADGSIRTGDLGWIDDVGRLRLAGRSKEMYVRGGYNVHPQEVERVLLEHPDVADVCVVPRTDLVMGEIGVAVVVPRRGVASPPTLDGLREFGRPHLAAYKLPEDIRVVDALPLTSMEKVDRRTLATQVAASVTPPGRSPAG